MPLAASIKNALGFAATRLLPQALVLRASPEARRRLRVKVSAARFEVVDERSRRMIWLARNNAVYVPDMMNAFDYYFESAEPFQVAVNDARYEVIDFSTPRYQKVRGFDDFPLLCPSLTEPFITAQQYLDFASLAPGNTVVDLGCYSGLTAIAFSRAVGAAGKVIALEPDPQNHAAALVNIEQHKRTSGLENITLHKAAAHSECGTLTFSSEGAMGSAVADVVGNYRGEIVSVDALTLDELAHREQLSRVDFVKIDIEGAEERVLGAAASFIRRYRPRVMIEPHVVGGRLSDKPVIGILESLGYACKVVTQHGVELPLVTGAPRLAA